MNNKKKEYSNRKTSTDVMVDNLLKRKTDKDDGSFITTSKADGSFSNVNTGIYGVEQDADDL